MVVGHPRTPALNGQEAIILYETCSGKPSPAARQPAVGGELQRHAGGPAAVEHQAVESGYSSRTGGASRPNHTHAKKDPYHDNHF